MREDHSELLLALDTGLRGEGGGIPRRKPACGAEVSRLLPLDGLFERVEAPGGRRLRFVPFLGEEEPACFVLLFMLGGAGISTKQAAPWR